MATLSDAPKTANQATRIEEDLLVLNVMSLPMLTTASTHFALSKTSTFQALPSLTYLNLCVAW